MSAPDRPTTPEEAARAFIGAIAWGEHHRVWELLGAEGRVTVLRVAAAGGMDAALAARLREGTASDAERDEFLTDLVIGLRADLAGCDLDTLDYETDPGPVADGRARVVMLAPLQAAMQQGGLPVGAIELVDGEGGWQVDRLMPKVTGG